MLLKVYLVMLRVKRFIISTDRHSNRKTTKLLFTLFFFKIQQIKQPKIKKKIKKKEQSKKKCDTNYRSKRTSSCFSEGSQLLLSFKNKKGNDFNKRAIIRNPSYSNHCAYHKPKPKNFQDKKKQLFFFSMSFTI